LTPAGKLDPTFGSGGIDQLNLGDYSHAIAVAVAANGGIALAGDQSPSLQAVNAVVARLKPNGALDPGFAGVGAATFVDPYGGANAIFNAVAFQSNGAIVVGGGAVGGSENADAVLIRCTTSGGKDGSFGSAGVAATPSATGWTIGSDNVVPGVNALAIPRNGDVVAAGRSANSVITYGTVWAFKSNGRPDTMFGSHGAAVYQNTAGLNTSSAGSRSRRSTGHCTRPATARPSAAAFRDSRCPTSASGRRRRLHRPRHRRHGRRCGSGSAA
jgi:uncharacterized delta-60 repeat protein